MSAEDRQAKLKAQLVCCEACLCAWPCRPRVALLCLCCADLTRARSSPPPPLSSRTRSARSASNFWSALARPSGGRSSGRCVARSRCAAQLTPRPERRAAPPALALRFSGPADIPLTTPLALCASQLASRRTSIVEKELPQRDLEFIEEQKEVVEARYACRRRESRPGNTAARPPPAQQSSHLC